MEEANEPDSDKLLGSIMRSIAKIEEEAYQRGVRDAKRKMLNLFDQLEAEAAQRLTEKETGK